MRMRVNQLIEELERQIPTDFADVYSMFSPSSAKMEGGRDRK